MLRQHRLRWLMATGLAACLLVSVAALGVLIYVQVSSYVWKAGEDHLRSIAEASLARVRGDNSPTTSIRPQQGPLEAPDDLAAAAPELVADLQARDTAVWVLDANGRVLARGSLLPDAPALDSGTVTLVRRRLALRPAASVSVGIRGPRATWQVVLIPLVHGGDLVGVIRLAAPFTPAEELLASLRRWLLAGAAGALAVGTLLGLLFAGVLTRPLERMAAAARAIAAGDLDRRVSLPPGDNEVYATAAAFDAMVERLQSSLAVQRRLVADASHELKTPLTAIAGMAEMLRLGADRGDPAARQRMLAALEREADRLGRLVRDLLTLAQSDEARPRERVPADLADLARHAALLAAQAYPDRQILVDLPTALIVEVEPDLIERAVLNLLDNAAKFSPPGGAVELGGSIEAAQAVLRVRDRGQGIPEADLPFVFDRFYRSDRSRNRDSGGSGLGLALVKTAAEQHGGQVEIESVEGEGTTVTLRLPLSARAVPPEPSVAAEATASYPG